MANEISRFWNGTTPGDAGPYSYAQMLEVLMQIAGYAGNGSVSYNNSVILGSGDGTNAPLLVMPASPAAASVRVALGRALVQGLFYVNSAVQTLAIASNSSGNPRIDTIILRANYTAQTVRLAVLQGTPAASPVRPTLTQSPGATWEVPLADIAVANGFLSIIAANIGNYPLYSNMDSVLAHDGVLNTQGTELKTGDVGVWDTVTGGASAKKTTTANDPKVAGVWVGLTPASGSGRLIYSGLAWVNVSAATAIGDQLVTSTTAGSARKAASGEKYILGYALTSTVGVGQVLAFIGIVPVAANFHSGVSVTRNGSLALTGSYQDLSFTAEVYDTDNYFTATSPTITFPITGRYLITGVINENGASSGTIDVNLRINGSNIQNFTGPSNGSATISYMVSVTAGDLLTFQVKSAGSPAGSATGGIQAELMTS